MTVNITDSAGQPIAPEKLETLALWNDTVEHICATAMARVVQEEPKAS